MTSVGAFEGVHVDQMYREHLLDHYRNPRHFGTLKDAEHIHDLNPLCGDELEFFAVFDGTTIKQVSFNGQGCALSVASASMLADEVLGKDGRWVKGLSRESMTALVGVDVAPMRVKCMMLPVKILKTLVYLHEGKTVDGELLW